MYLVLGLGLRHQGSPRTSFLIDIFAKLCLKGYDKLLILYFLTEGRYIPPHLRNREASKGKWLWQLSIQLFLCFES